MDAYIIVFLESSGIFYHKPDSFIISISTLNILMFHQKSQESLFMVTDYNI